MSYAKTLSERLVSYSSRCVVEGKTSGGKKKHRIKITLQTSEL